MKVEIYSDVMCPWCYVGERRFARALAAFPRADEVEIVFRPYQLDPNAPDTPMSQAEYLEQRFGRRASGMHGQVDAAGADVGIEFAWDKALTVNTRTAHRLLRLAEKEYGAAMQRALADRLFELHFTRGGDVSDHVQLADEAGAVGMDRERVRTYLDSGKGLQELEAEFDAARSLGIRAVPSFVFNGESLIEGAQSPATFLAALEQVAATSASTSDEAGACVDGVCEV